MGVVAFGPLESPPRSRAYLATLAYLTTPIQLGTRLMCSSSPHRNLDARLAGYTEFWRMLSGYLPVGMLYRIV